MVSGIMKYMLQSVDMKKLVLAQEPAFDANITIKLKKNSIYYEEINRYAGYARDGGLIDRWIYNEMKFERESAFEGKKKEIKCDSKDNLSANYATEDEQNDGIQTNTSEKRLKVQNLVAIALAYIFGICLAIVCIVGEFITYGVKLKLNLYQNLSFHLLKCVKKCRQKMVSVKSTHVKISNLEVLFNKTSKSMDLNA